MNTDDAHGPGTQEEENLILDPNEELFTEAQAAKEIKVAKITLQRRRHTRQIGFYRIGNKILYARKHLQEFLRRCERQPRVLHEVRKERRA